MNMQKIPSEQSSRQAHRRSIRLNGYDYSQPGWYFITICCHNRARFFGDIENDEMVLNEYGKIAHDQWTKLSKRFPNIVLDAFQIMPNHIHGVIHIIARDDRAGATVGNVVGAYKSLVSNVCLAVCKSKNETMGKIWQRNYYEHIIRDQVACPLKVVPGVMRVLMRHNAFGDFYEKEDTHPATDSWQIA